MFLWYWAKSLHESEDEADVGLAEHGLLLWSSPIHSCYSAVDMVYD